MMRSPDSGIPGRGRRAPRWLRLINPINRFLLRLGIGPAPQHLLTVVGRKTGRPRTTPVAIVMINDVRYIVAGFEESDWVRNARAARQGVVGRGRRVENVSLVEVPAGERARILHAFAQQVPGGRSFLTLPTDASPAALEQAGSRHPVFRVEAT
jgi:deazaflavin-dependent oxidoreductase (nitroreductase family)